MLPDIQKCLELLADTPRRLDAASVGVDEVRLRLKPDPSCWSALEILAHLRACADVWGASIESMLADEEPELPNIHPRQWLKRTNYVEIHLSNHFSCFLSNARNYCKP